MKWIQEAYHFGASVFAEVEGLTISVKKDPCRDGKYLLQTRPTLIVRYELRASTLEGAKKEALERVKWACDRVRTSIDIQTGADTAGAGEQTS